MSFQHFPDGVLYARWVDADQSIRPLLDCDRALRILANRQARHSESRGLFLNSARIREDQPRMVHQTQEIQISQWGRHDDPARFQTVRQHHFPGTRVNREDDRETGADSIDCLQQPAQRLRMVHVRRPVQRKDSELPRSQAQTMQYVRGARPLTEAEQSVDHNVAGEENPAFRHAFPAEIIDPAPLAREQVIR